MSTMLSWRCEFRPLALASLLAALVAVTALSAPGYAASTSADEVFGSLRFYIPDGEATLLDVARDNDLGILEIQAANPGVDPWVPGAEIPVLLPTSFIVPDAPREGIVINLAELRLYRFKNKTDAPESFTIGIGREGFTTPLGQTRVVRKAKGPTWYPTSSARRDNPELPTAVPAGPDNPLGDYALYLGWDTYLIHGTNKPWGVGRRVSRGCIRMYPERVEQLFADVPVGTKVTVINQAVKLGWRGNDLFIEVHPNLLQLDELEDQGNFAPDGQDDVYDLIFAKIGSEESRLDWNIIDAAITQRLGIPVRITVPAETQM